MKKTQLRKIIKESIKELMNEQSSGVIVNMRTCNGGLTFQNHCLPSGAQVGDVYQVTVGSNTRKYFVRDVGGPCPSYLNPNGQALPPSSCPNCCSMSSWQSYSTNFGGACTTNQTGGSCTGGQAPSCPGWSGYSNWESNCDDFLGNYHNL